MRVVLSSSGSRSEVFPLFALAGELASRQHTVTLCVPEKYRSRLMVLQHRMVTCGAGLEEYLEGSRTGDAAAFVRSLAAQIPSQFVAMRDALREADVLVAGGFMLAGASQAQVQGIPYFCLVQTPLFLDAEQFPSAGMALQKGLFDSVRRRRKEWEELVLPALNREREFSHLGPISNLHQYLYRTGHALAAFDPSVASITAGVSETVTGFLHFDDSGFVSDELVSFVKDGDPPVLIEPLGLSAEESTAFLEQLCQHLSSAGIRAVVSPRWPGAGEANLPSTSRVLDAFPSSHFSAVLHLGTPVQFAAAVYAGIPQVTCPLLVEHGFWSEKVRALGVGPEAVQARDAGRIAAAVREAATRESWRERSRDLAAQLSTRNGASVAADTIEKFGAEAGHGG